MQFPAFAVVLIGVVSLGRIFTVHLIHGEYRSQVSGALHPFILQDSVAVGNGVGLGDTPFGVDEVTHVHDVKTQLEAMLGLANLCLLYTSDAADE